MSDFTSVNAAAMSTGIQDLSQANRRLTSDLEELKGQLNSSLNQWDGAAQAAYGEVQRQWDASAQKMNEIVAKMTTVLNSIQEGYHSNESAITSSWA